MRMGAFSVSRSVKDLSASIAFYKTLGFETFGGDQEQGYVIMKNGDTLVGLFHGMFEGNMLTFNPGWTQSAENTETFDDVREIHATSAKAGHDIVHTALEAEAGPGSFVLRDPDGNVILVDQHR